MKLSKSWLLVFSSVVALVLCPLSTWAAWCGNSYAFVGASSSAATWYTCSNTYLQAGGYFHGANLGTISTLPLGGEVQVWRDTGTSTAEMGYRIEGPVTVGDQSISMTDVGDEGNTDKYQIPTPADLIAAHNLTDGTYTVSIWFHSTVSGAGNAGANGEAYDSNNSLNYTASFTVGAGGGGGGGGASGLGTCWHCPTNHEPYADVCMRSPITPEAGWVQYIRVGNYQSNGDMTGGTLHYRYGDTNSWGAWSTAAFNYETQSTNTSGQAVNNFWVASNTVPADAAGKFFQYYMEIAYANDATLSTTYIYMNPDDSGIYLLSSNAATAAASPFEVGIRGASAQEPGYIWHGGNIIRGGSDSSVQIWAKIGYVSDSTNRWADEAVIRYRIDTDPDTAARRSGVTKVKSSTAHAARSWNALTNEVAMSFQSIEDDSSENGNAMMWMGSINDAALANSRSVLIYEIYARKTTAAGGNGNWRQAEYSAGDGSCTFQYRMWSDGSGDLTVNGTPADYTTSKYFIDEADENDTVSVAIEYHAPTDADAVEIFSNFGRRDFVDVDMNNDGWPDGMIPPDGSTVTAAGTYNVNAGYWQAIPMTLGAGSWTKTLTTDKCGVYRITARYKARGSDTWTWYSQGTNGVARRDHVVVISPKKALTQTMYELNVLTTKATATSDTGAGSFETLSEKLGSGGPFDEFSLDYLNRLGVNCLWFQPIHPNLQYDRGNTDSDGNRYYPGSLYATKNYFSVNYETSSTKNEAGAVAAFTNYVRLCDKAQSDSGGTKNLETVNIMLDGVMNHTSWDAVFGEGLAFATNGLGNAALAELDTAYGSTWRNISASDCIPTTGLGINWYSHVADGTAIQSQPATRYTSITDNDIASAPERFDFGKWDDVAELLYGDYSTMVRYDDRVPPDYALTEETSRIYSEEDMYYYNEMLPATKMLWKYMAAYPEYWLKKTGNSGGNHPGVRDANGVLTDDYGIDGLRCDYAQGLPNQFWEYCINRTRTFKWNFLFMAESLDGGNVGYRSNRQFDILNENMVFRFTQDKVSTPAPFAAALEERRTAYGNGLILLNLTCHDEPMPFGDPQATASRYAMVSAIDGVPMIFYGQEHAISRLDSDFTTNKWKGFYKFEQNFGKYIPHFKSWNKMYVWDDPAYEAGTANDSRAVAQFYGRINLARQSSPALQSKNRWFLNDNDRIMCVAKWEAPGVNPNVQDAVLAAVLFLNEGEGGHIGAAQTYTLAPLAANLGIENSESKYYNVRNLVASNPNALLWESPRTGADIHANGIYIGFNGSSDGTTDAPATTWTDNGAVAQYLKIVDVTDYPVPVIGVGVIPTDKQPGEEVSFSVTATGTGNPVVTVTNVTPAGTIYTYASDTLSFTPTATNTFTFSFLAQNQYNDAFATTNVSVTIVSSPESPVAIEAIVSATVTSGAGGTSLALTATCTNLPAGFTVPVYTATALVNGNWNWTNSATATINGNNISVDVPFAGNELLISIGRPDYMR